MEKNRVSQESFLLTELLYTVSQLQVQLGALKASAEGAGEVSFGHAVSIVEGMIEAEERYRAQFAGILNVEIQQSEPKQGYGPEGFRSQREETVALLERVQKPWPRSLFEAVREVAANDRSQTTAIAQHRSRLLELDSRSNLDQPLHP